MKRSPTPIVARAVRPVIDALERRVLMSADVAAEVQSYDGTGNNLDNPQWGAVEVAYLRVADASYADGVSEPAGGDLASARAVSNVVVATDEDDAALSDRFLSAFVYAWGQFLDHDITLTEVGDEPIDIVVPDDDADFIPGSTIALTRSLGELDEDGVLQQINSNTGYIDGSMIYGSDEATANSLRSFEGGRMLVTDGGELGDLLPTDADGNYLAGDDRAAENSELLALQTLFVREHNRLAGEVAAENPDWTDEQVFQQARRLIIAEVQHITYSEFLPALLGKGAIEKYDGYDPTVNATITNEFAAAAYRLGHSLVGDEIEFIGNDGEELADPIPLAEVFFNPSIVATNGIEGLLKYLASDNSQEVDTHIVEDLRSFLFGSPGAGGLDLAALNIQRGRDHGLAGYNDTREALGLARVTSFAEITSDPEVAAELESVYGDVDSVELWVGGLAEDHVAGASVGATFRAILVDQFTRSRDGDRFWYENDLSGSDLRMVQRTSLADVIKANTAIDNLQRNVFVFNAGVTGTVFADANNNGRQDRREQGVRNVTVNLIDEDDVVVAVTQTDRRGVYHFEGLQLGDYHAVPQVGTDGDAFALVDVTRGGEIRNADVAIASPSVNPTPGRHGRDDLFAHREDDRERGGRSGRHA